MRAITILATAAGALTTAFAFTPRANAESIRRQVCDHGKYRIQTAKFGQQGRLSVSQCNRIPFATAINKVNVILYSDSQLRAGFISLQIRGRLFGSGSYATLNSW